MENKDLPSALCDSITDEAKSAITDILEVGLDSVFEDSPLKDVPLLSTVVSLYKIGNSIKERHYIKKLDEFIHTLNNGLAGDAQIKKFRDRILHDQEKSEKELEYILILVDRYISNGKSTIIAKLYLSYLDNKLTWEEFTMYSEVTDQLFIKDLDFLRKEEAQIVQDVSSATALRLTSLGLLFEDHGIHDFNYEDEDLDSETKANDKIFSRTAFGTKYIEIIDSTNS